MKEISPFLVYKLYRGLCVTHDLFVITNHNNLRFLFVYFVFICPLYDLLPSKRRCECFNKTTLFQQRGESFHLT